MSWLLRHRRWTVQLSFVLGHQYRQVENVSQDSGAAASEKIHETRFRKKLDSPSPPFAIIVFFWLVWYDWILLCCRGCDSD